MGMFDDQSYDPTNPNDQTEKYKQPGSDPFAEFGIMTPMQKDAQAFQMQQQLRQQQMQLQIQQATLQRNQQQGSVDAAGLASGYSFPTYLALQAGKSGGDNPMMTRGLTQLGSMGAQALGGQPNNGVGVPMPGGGGPPGGGGMMGSGGQRPMMGQPTTGMMAGPVPDNDPSMILTRALQSSNDPGTAYLTAGQQLAAQATQTGNAELARSATAMIVKGQTLKASQDAQAAGTEEKKSATTKNLAEAAKDQADLKYAKNVHPIDFPDGGTGLAWQTPDGTWKTGFKGEKLQRTLDTTPAQKGKEVEDFQELTRNVAGTSQKIDQVKQNLAQGAAAGSWAEAGVGTVNNIVGTLGQLVPGSKMEESAVNSLNDLKAKGTFKGWADKTAINESVLNDLTMNLAKTYAGPGGKVSNIEIRRAAETIGEHIGSPSTFIKVLDDVKTRTNDDYNTQYKLYKGRLTDPKEINAMDSLYNTGQSMMGNSHPSDIAGLLKKYN